MDKYFRVIKSGAILPFSERLIGNKDVELVLEQEAFPEKFAPVDLSKRAKNIEISIPDAILPPKVDPSPELTQEASSRMEKKVSVGGGTKSAPKKAEPFDFAGL